MPPRLVDVIARSGKAKQSATTQASINVLPQNHRPGESEQFTQFPGGLWLVGIHGGAGTTTLAAAGVGGDGGRRWPEQPEQSGHPATVHRLAPGGLLLVVRETASALTVATKAAEAVQRGQIPDWLQMLGLIVVAAGPGRPAKVIRQRTTLIAGWIPRMWRVPWVPELLATDADQVRYCKAFKAAIPPSLYELQELRKK